MNRSPGPTPAPVDDEEDRVRLGDHPLDPALHPLGEGRVARPLYTRQVSEHLLPPAGVDRGSQRP